MNKTGRKYIWCAISIFLGVFFLFILFSGQTEQTKKISDFLGSIENKTFDIRQNVTAKYRKEHKKHDDIVILSIDDDTYEYVLENYGEWPMPRYIYADVVNFIEKQNPKIIAFDLLFVKSIKDNNNSDEKLTNLFKEYSNIYTSYSFDDLDTQLRTPVDIDDKFSVNLENKNDSEILSFENYRPILESITNTTSNAGHVNTQRSEDGVIRDFYPFVTYKNKIYPHLALLIAQKELNSASKDFIIGKDSKLSFGKYSYPISKRGTMILNWYGDKDAYEHVSFAQVIESINHEKAGKPSLLKDNLFNNKIVYIGTTSPNLNDIKTVPTDKFMPGVETHTTFIDNMLNNEFIHRLSFEWDFTITLVLCLFIGLTMLRVEYSKINYKYMIPINSLILLVTLVLYCILSFLLMKYFNLWIALIMPAVGVILTFISVYVIRYFFKSKDYEYTYRLATTDGLTELYNHRYFQEKMIECVEEAKKTGKEFSLILTDIDFFKKFNDKYGHQAGDAVLRQVARTLKKNVKKTDYVCRYGGEEMSVILKNADNKNAHEVAQRLCDAVSANTCKLGPDLEANVTISLGVATYPQHGNTPTELIEYSDKGLYSAKENGRNQVGKI